MKALIVDDSAAMRLILGELVAGHGFEVREAADGREALSILEEERVPELALVDWNMPGLNGLDIIRTVRSESRYEGMRLLVVTSEAGLQHMQDAVAAGADEYLMKPFSSEALESKLALLGLSYS